MKITTIYFTTIYPYIYSFNFVVSVGSLFSMTIIKMSCTAYPHKK